VPGNIGASARAIKTMGFQSLILVKPGSHLSEEAQWMAHGSVDVLEGARVLDQFEPLMDEMDFLIGTTAKRRSVKYNYHAPETLRQLIENKGKLMRNVGLVFGGEESGLSNEILQKCDVVSSLPMADKYPSLNLSQAVMVYAYVLSGATSSAGNFELENHHEFDIFKSRVEFILEKLDIKRGTNLYNRIRERLMTVGEEDIHLLLSFSNKLERMLTPKPEGKEHEEGKI